ncbi:unnamed protein product [Acanthoscelides obtectus]|uniref:Uncharacterized protein n=1 Tax=Acanthoscelides obtectus TaxID=200917 RepID=A0A9P0LAI4_ACAOB|nr:unnamed protein product [Acanthoscelides obtectus]CAK1649287.1 hypothetical protein AOBTE_LOCUS16132 [Acanthoscelides obtectus]
MNIGLAHTEIWRVRELMATCRLRSKNGTNNEQNIALFSTSVSQVIQQRAPLQSFISSVLLLLMSIGMLFFLASLLFMIFLSLFLVTTGVLMDAGIIGVYKLCDVKFKLLNNLLFGKELELPYNILLSLGFGNTGV